MQLTLSAAFTLLTCAISTVSATFDRGHHVHVARAAFGSEHVERSHHGKRFDPNTQALTKIGMFDTVTGASLGFLSINGDYIRNVTATEATQWQYTKPANPGDKFDIEYPIAGGAYTRQLVIATKNTATVGLNSPTADGTKRSDLYGVAWPLRSPAGSVPIQDAIHETWFESAVWTLAADGTLSCTWINPDGTPVPLIPFMVVEALHFSPNTDILYSWGGPWFDLKRVTLKFVN
ncbi:SubName: Full=Uncharacterized protein {ECO:0000313/EMBL:CCA73306.1} [Serendipita indica DSM 11827]|uniref:Uncharacterized protein n=1 Tax=Serendipita indica (strain DSM 11827) TaxID=1109443 RepID=G4TPR3_SERID|nr:SubName: Full=Uncharacterized protein {ECO:0000313/EMBL:CCA73306.1} [Serendipita indica DSM 11827]CCA73306.1 hypothetical protein PIIN_07261 [Serendipita indica DSM 11827]